MNGKVIKPILYIYRNVVITYVNNPSSFCFICSEYIFKKCCLNVSDLMVAMGLLNYDSSEKCLFLDSSKRSLEFELLHSGLHSPFN